MLESSSLLLSALIWCLKRKLFKKYNVVAIKADWSKKDDIILNALKKLGVNSVPCNVMYIKGKEPCILPSIININNIEELFC